MQMHVRFFSLHATWQRRACTNYNGFLQTSHNIFFLPFHSRILIDFISQLIRNLVMRSKWYNSFELGMTLDWDGKNCFAWTVVISCLVFCVWECTGREGLVLGSSNEIVHTGSRWCFFFGFFGGTKRNCIQIKSVGRINCSFPFRIRRVNWRLSGNYFVLVRGL